MDGMKAKAGSTGFIENVRRIGGGAEMDQERRVDLSRHRRRELVAGGDVPAVTPPVNQTSRESDLP